MTFYNGQKILKKRLRDIDKNPFGVVVALNKKQFGYSICHSKLDKYDDEKGLTIAIGRAQSKKKTNFNFWLKKRMKTIRKNPIRDFFEGNIETKKDFKECIENSFSSDAREIIALQELQLMEERAKKYFKKIK
jgi:hypothetical protein